MPSDMSVVTLRDGTDIHVRISGSGRPVVLLHGWSQSGAQFDSLAASLALDFKVFTPDMRGHGQSPDVGRGYRISKFASDLSELLEQFGLENATLIGHSMGCSVIWAYLEQYGDARIQSLVLIDEPACLLRGRHWSDQDAIDRGGIFDEAALFGLIEALRGPNAEATTRAVLQSMLTPGPPPGLLNRLVAENLTFPRAAAADLMTNHAVLDWSDVISAIRLPTLVMGGMASLVAESHMRWIASQIQGAKLRILTVEEGGGHFPMLENPALVSTIITEFLASQNSSSNLDGQKA